MLLLLLLEPASGLLGPAGDGEPGAGPRGAEGRSTGGVRIGFTITIVTNIIIIITNLFWYCLYYEYWLINSNIMIISNLIISSTRASG